MFWNFALGIAAGYLTPMAEPHIRRALEKNAFRGELPFGRAEMDMFALLVMLLAAAIVVKILGVDSSAFALCLGALGGLFGKRIYEALMNKDMRPGRGSGRDD